MPNHTPTLSRKLPSTHDQELEIGAQLSTSHSSPSALEASRMLETVRLVREAIGLDCLVVGFREFAGGL